MEHKSIYTPDVIARLELGWGPGWLSPGGLGDVSQLVAGVAIAGKSVLDIGTGTGGPALALVRKFGARRVTGIDVEQSVLDRARTLVQAEELEQQIDFRRVAPGHLPFPDAHFDVVFSKDTFVHIADKTLLFAEIFRVLKPGGRCVFSDWCCSPPPYSEEMQQFFNNGMNFTMATLEENCSHLERAGFNAISGTDRNAWFAVFAAQEVKTAAGAERARLVSAIGADAADSLTAAARRRAVIADQGHLRPTHFRAAKPDD
ncbi:MAG: class I SAM-dependent methyltransferase [Anderseniella sp.]